MLSLVEVPFGDERVQGLVAQVQAYYAEIYGSPDEGPVGADEFAGDRGRFFLGFPGSAGAGVPDGAVAMGGWRWRTDLAGRFGWERAVEVKRMFVVPEARGRGHARAMLAGLERSAAAAGAVQVVLETGSMQPEAIALYTSSGYSPVVPFGHYAHSELVRCFGKVLATR